MPPAEGRTEAVPALGFLPLLFLLVYSSQNSAPAPGTPLLPAPCPILPLSPRGAARPRTSPPACPTATGPPPASSPARGGVSLRGEAARAERRAPCLRPACCHPRGADPSPAGPPQEVGQSPRTLHGDALPESTPYWSPSQVGPWVGGGSGRGAGAGSTRGLTGDEDGGRDVGVGQHGLHHRVEVIERAARAALRVQQHQGTAGPGQDPVAGTWWGKRGSEPGPGVPCEPGQCLLQPCGKESAGQGLGGPHHESWGALGSPRSPPRSCTASRGWGRG